MLKLLLYSLWKGFFPLSIFTLYFFDIINSKTFYICLLCYIFILRKITPAELNIFKPNNRERNFGALAGFVLFIGLLIVFQSLPNEIFIVKKGVLDLLSITQITGFLTGYTLFGAGLSWMTWINTRNRIRILAQELVEINS